MKMLLDYFRNRQENILNLIHQIVEIESPSYDVKGSRAVVERIAREAAQISAHFQIEKIFAESFGEHLLIRAFPSENKPVLLLGHTDTVHPIGEQERNPTRVEADKFYGAGVFDMKANCVLMLEILRLFTELNLRPKRPLTILLSCDEEVGSQTGRWLVEREASAAEFCLVGEPSANGAVKTGRKGTGNYHLTARGIPAHAGLEPECGASAILEIARQIERIHLLNDREKGTTANVCTVRGGTTTNVIPENAVCSIDVRFTSLNEARRVEKELKNLQSFDRRVSLEIAGEINRPPLERTTAIVKLYEKARRIALEFDYELFETQVGGASDGNFVGALGIPVLDGLGVAGGGAHTSEEFVYVADIPKRAALLAALLLAD